MENRYPYVELLDTLILFIESGEIPLDGKIWIVRTDEPAFDNYCPIVDFYPLHILQYVRSKEERMGAVTKNVDEVILEMVSFG